MSPDDRSAYVTNTVTAGPRRFVAFNSDGGRAEVRVFDAKHTRSGLAVVDTAANAVLTSVPMRAKPYVAAVARDGPG